jgi:hypothetical protein
LPVVKIVYPTVAHNNGLHQITGITRPLEGSRDLEQARAPSCRPAENGGITVTLARNVKDQPSDACTRDVLDSSGGAEAAG